ncbi:cation-translocating P-type ATPase [Marinovum sp.]|uniref:cation-translocating P-type ATPase n=1 Tax=Marinovum sp. TaxID=2024839 RepID=UPI003A950072
MQDPKLDQSHALTSAEVAARLSVTPGTGLSRSEAARRRERFGPNRLREQKPVSALVLLGHQFRSVIVWLLAAAAVFSLLVGDNVEAAAIGTVLALNAAIGFFTELRAARSMEALQKMADVRTRVRRDGQEQTIDARDLVPGDVVLLEGGDVVTADLRLVSASNLQADESVLTGESAPVEKSYTVSSDLAANERPSMVFKGTSITQGACEAIVVGTGMNTELGRISRLAESATAEASPLEVRLERLGRTLIWLTLVMAAGTVAAGLYRGHEFAEMVRTGIALAVAAIPEGLPVVATLSLARGMWRMARRNAMIRRLSAVETLGATTLILTDKTGTLTENRMTAVHYLLEGGEVDLEEGAVPNPSEAFQLALKIGALCNTAELGRDGGEDNGDPMELALLKAAEATGQGERISLKQLAQHAFDPQRRMMATVHDAPEGVLVAVKGAPEAVLAACTQVLAPTGISPLDDAARAQWLRRNQDEAASGLRTLGLAMKQATAADADPYTDLVLLGIVCLADPLRPEIPSAIAACRAAGIRVVMVTGDHAATASRIARDAGIAQEDSGVVEGREILGLESAGDDLLTRLRAADVVARVAPDTKLALVALHQRGGQIVAMTGDGVNDAPALRKADIGVAMGQRGTQVAREAAHMVLKDDDFATIVEAVRQGRVIFGNIRKFIIYLMSCNL